jgi:hypothetical protein
MTPISYDTAQLVLPLMDFVSRWAMFGCKERSAALAYFRDAGFEPYELAAIEAFLTALDDNPEDDEDEDEDIP